MNCLTNEVIQSYTDGELSKSEMDVVNSHLLECRDCQKKVNERKTEIRLLKSELKNLNPQSVKIPEFEYPHLEKPVRKIYRISFSRLWKIIIGTTAVIAILIVVQLRKNREDSKLAKITEYYYQTLEDYQVQDPYDFWLNRRVVIIVTDKKDRIIEKIIISLDEEKVVHSSVDLELSENQD